MANPFTTFRAAEHADTMEGFLSLVVPEPLDQYFSKFFHDGVLFRRAMFVYGQPGSGKTTLARLFEPMALATLLRNDSSPAFAAVRVSVARTGALGEDRSSILGARIPMESDFRDLADLPYSPEIKKQLLLRLVQARTVLRWFSQLQQVGVSPAAVEVVAKDGFESNLASVGGNTGNGLVDRARVVESQIYNILGALVPPSEGNFSAELQQPYQLFDILAEFKIPAEVADSHNLDTRLRPFVILDDAHSLATQQFQDLRQWIVRREIAVGRWVLSRLDALSPSEVASEFTLSESQDDVPGVSQQRDFDVIALQGIGTERSEARRQFKKVAEAMGRRYLKQVEAFNRSQISELSSILETSVTAVQEPRLAEWKVEIKREVQKRGLSKSILDGLTKTADALMKQKGESGRDLHVALMRILVHRRAVVRQLSLFENEDTEAVLPQADAGLFAGAEIHLARSFGRPYFYGFNQLALASSENPEMFVRLAGALVDASLNQMLRRKKPALSAAQQDRLLREKAMEMTKQWNFPEAAGVRRLIHGIAARCAKATDAPNAYLRSGANAIGIPMADYELLLEQSGHMSSILKYGVAYSAFSVSLDRSVKNKSWCLITLGGIACISNGLTLALGGFVEGTGEELESLVLLK